ncbi:hypothetical protein M8J75_015765 [Diaphorina citri]|nr:hypothetical protein M8J75_015765 [Diaphorina citri]
MALALFIITICLTSSVTASNILVCPTASYSHQQPFLIISKALLQHNHKVTLMTTNPEKMESHENLTTVDWSFTYNVWKKSESLDLQTRKSQWTNVRFFASKFSTTCTSAQWAHSNTQRFIKEIVSANKTYDLLIIECWAHQSYLGLVDLIGNPPVIMTATAHSFAPLTMPFNNPENPAYVPVLWTANTDTMTFWQRVTNTVQYHMYNWYFMKTMQEEDEVRHANLDKKYIKRSLREIFMDGSKNSFMGSFDSRITGHVRPVQPKIVEVGPLHLVQPKPLDQKLQTWMNGAEKGVIYFSLGSNMKGSSMGDFRRKAFLKAFARLPQYRVLWKWETDDVMEGQSENVRLQKWMPQQDVLAHPKVKLFIMQGGLQSLQEAFHYGVKLICIPMFGDQDLNAQRIAKIKTGVVLEFDNLNEDNIYDALITVLEDPIYEENMQYYSLLSKDTPMSPIEKSIWWIEYVLRHKGVAHLHSAAADLSYVQYYLLDVIAFIITILLVLLLALYLAAVRVLRKLNVIRLESEKDIKKKIK